MQNFFDKWQSVFEVVTRLLGNGWRINRLDDCQYRIKLTTPELKGYAITIREEKSRLLLSGFAESQHWRGLGAQCTVSPSRTVTGIADDIRRKILVTAREDVKKAQEAEQAIRDAQEQDIIIKGMISQLVKLEYTYFKYTGFRAENGLHGSVEKYQNDYELTIKGLSIEQLIKLIGHIKQL